MSARRTVVALAVLAAVALAAPTAVGQPLNIDLGTHLAAPSAAFGAAANQPGSWSDLGVGTYPALVGLSGAATGVSATVTAQDPDGFSIDCTGDMSALLADNIYSAGVPWTVALSGLANGTYRVYAYGPTNTVVTTGAMTANGVPLAEVSGDSCTLAEGTTHSTAWVQVTAGTLTITGSGAGYVGLSALQLVPLRLLGTLGAGSGTSTLVEVDPATGGIVQTIGNVGYLVNGMTFDATTGTLYATTSYVDGLFPNGLLTINMTTGAGTPVGTGTGRLVNVPACDAAGTLYGWTESGDDLVLWNKAAGTVTVVGDSGLGTASQGLAFDNAGTLWLVNYGGSSYTMDTATGAASYVGSIGTTAHHGTFHPVTGLYYGISSTSAPKDLVTANLTTTTVVSSVPTDGTLHTLAFIGAPGGAAPPPVPTITNVSPTSGTTLGGTTVTITGTGFTGATAVTFGGTAATSFTVDSDTQVTATTPAHAAGAVDVAVTAPGGTATSAGAYTYVVPPPTITGLSPYWGPAAGGITVTITGLNLSSPISVTFGGVAATITGSSDTSITVTLPPHPLGSVDVVVTTAGGSATRVAGFLYQDVTVVPTLSGWMLGILAFALAAAGALKLRA